MEITISYNITGCNDCPLKRSYTGHGENFYYCTHPNSPKGYDSVLANYGEVLFEEWCPIKDQLVKGK